MKLFIVTIFDSTSTQENPIKPTQVVVNQDSLSATVVDHVDETHYVIVSSIDGEIG